MSALPTPEAVEANNQRWWALHREDKPFRATVGLSIKPVWPPKSVGEDGRTVYEAVGPFCHCPLPVAGIEWWGFTRRVDLDRFVQLYHAMPER